MRRLPRLAGNITSAKSVIYPKTLQCGKSRLYGGISAGAPLLKMRRISSGFRSGPPFRISALAALISGAGAGGVRESGLDGGFGLGGFGIIAMGLGLGEYGCILCLPAGMILTPSSFIITIGLWTNPPGRRIGLRFVFIIAPVTIIRCAATGFSSTYEPDGISSTPSFHTVCPFFRVRGKGNTPALSRPR